MATTKAEGPERVWLDSADANSAAKFLIDNVTERERLTVEYVRADIAAIESTSSFEAGCAFVVATLLDNLGHFTAYDRAWPYCRRCGLVQPHGGWKKECSQVLPPITPRTADLAPAGELVSRSDVLKIVEQGALHNNSVADVLYRLRALPPTASLVARVPDANKPCKACRLDKHDDCEAAWIDAFCCCADVEAETRKRVPDAARTAAEEINRRIAAIAPDDRVEKITAIIESHCGVARVPVAQALVEKNKD